MRRAARAQQLKTVAPAAAKVQAKLTMGAAGDEHEREADRVADQVMQSPDVKRPPRITPIVQRKQADQGDLQAKAQGGSVMPGSSFGPRLRREALGGAPLPAAARSFFEPRFGRDLGHVRIHDGASAGALAAEIKARAFASGGHVYFGEGQYHPRSAQGRGLLAHEIAHTFQQGAGGRVIQRVGVLEALSRFFGGGSFSEKELKAYLDSLEKRRRIEDDYDSDNKAREVVRRWKAGDAAFRILTVPIRILLIKEMTSGYLSGDDQNAIFALINESIDSEQKTIFKEIDTAGLIKRFDGAKKTALRDLAGFITDISGLPSSGWTVAGVQKILHRHGDEHIIKTILDKGIKVIRFKTAFITWRYTDGRVEEEEMTGVRGAARKDLKKIWLRDTLPNEQAASTLFHEVSHHTGSIPDFVEDEIDVRVRTEEFRIRHGMPPVEPDYRTPDGTIDKEAIRRSITGSDVYNPSDREQAGSRFGDEEEVSGWAMP